MSVETPDPNLVISFNQNTVSMTKPCYDRPAIVAARDILSKARFVDWNYYQGVGHWQITPDEQQLKSAIAQIDHALSQIQSVKS